MALLPLSSSATPRVNETMALTEGWNAVYIECTPTNPACEAFFRDTPVIAAAAFRSDAYSETAQYDADGNEKLQAPIPFLQWSRGEENASALRSIVGGGTYLLFATNAANIAFEGVPGVPRMTWRKVSSSETNEFFNLAGVSTAQETIPIKDYFGEGPFGMATSGRAIYSIGGTDPQTPVLKDAEHGGFGRLTPIVRGKAYALTSTSSRDWPGVVGVQNDSVSFDAGGNYASVKVKNCGTTNHVFRFTMTSSKSVSGEEPPPISRCLPRVDAFSAQQYTNVEESVAWTVELAPDEETEQVFSLNRSKLETGKEYGAILEIEDTGASKMRVRMPITVAATSESAEAVKFPVGLWSGYIQMETVSRLDDPLPVKAGGTLKMNVMMHVAANGDVKLLQRVAAGTDTNGTWRLFRELESVPATVNNARRFSTVMMSIDNPVVDKTSGAFGDSLAFDWTIGERASDNPFRHAWHPDHDGKKADYSGSTPSGDDLANYANVVKPELWSITNRMEFSWHENNDPHAPVNYEWTPSEKTAGFVTWTVSGLTAKEPIRSLGVFVLQRAIKAAEVE